MLLDILFLQDAEGHELRRITLTDITELKHAQEELRLHKEELEELVAERTAELLQANEQLREANGNLEALFQAAPLAIVVFDAEGKVTNINPAAERLYGWTLQEVQGRLPLSIPAEYPEESLALLQRVLQGESFTGVEIKQQRQDGTLLDGSVSAAPLHDANGKLRGFVGLAEDITQRKQAEEALHTQVLVLASMAEGVAVTDQRGESFTPTRPLTPCSTMSRGNCWADTVISSTSTRRKRTAPWSRPCCTRSTPPAPGPGNSSNCRKNGKPFFTQAHISRSLWARKNFTSPCRRTSPSAGGPRRCSNARPNSWTWPMTPYWSGISGAASPIGTGGPKNSTAGPEKRPWQRCRTNSYRPAFRSPC